MKTVREIYNYLDGAIPRSLSCDWDNDGMMCSPDTAAAVSRVILTLDITGDAVKFAIDRNAGLIISHHPLVFKPLKGVEPGNPVASRIIKLINHGISAISFHTRLDALEGGVNDALAQVLGVMNPSVFTNGSESIGRVGNVNESSLPCFAAFVKDRLGADFVSYVDAGKPVNKVALVGGDGKDFLGAALSTGADTYITGAMSYNTMVDARELGINVIEAGHFFTENPVLERLAELLYSLDKQLEVIRYDSNPVVTCY